MCPEKLSPQEAYKAKQKHRRHQTWYSSAIFAGSPATWKPFIGYKEYGFHMKTLPMLLAQIPG